MSADEPDDMSAARLIYQSQQRGKFCDVAIKIAGKEFLAHKVVLDPISQYFRTELSDDWVEQRNTRRQYLVSIEDMQEIPQDGTKSEPDREILDVDLPFMAENTEKHETFEQVLKYIYLGTLELEEKLSFERWLQLIQAADYLIIEKLFRFLTDYFKKHFMDLASPSAEILKYYQQCANYEFLFSLCEQICQFIKANLHRIIYCLKSHAQQEIGCLAQNEDESSTEDGIGLFGDARKNTDGVGINSDYDQWPEELYEGATDENGNPLQRVEINGRLRWMTADAVQQARDEAALRDEQRKNQPEPLEENVPLQKCNELPPSRYQESELFRICSVLDFKVLQSILHGDNFSPRIGDLDVFYLIMAWAGTHSEVAPQRTARRALRSSHRQQRETIPEKILQQACVLLQSYMVKKMNDGDRTTRRLLRAKGDRGDLEAQVFKKFIENSPEKTPAKNFAYNFFEVELKKYHSISKIWRAKGDSSYHEYEECCADLFKAWLKITQPTGCFSIGSLFKRSKNQERELAMDDHVVPFPSGLIRKRKAPDSSQEDVGSEQSPEKYARIPYQAPLVVGSWCGKNEQEANYGPSSDMHVWDDSLNSWTKNPNSLCLPTKLCYNGRAFLEPYLYIFGGYDGQRSNSTGMDSAYKINIQTLEYEQIAPLGVKRLYITGCPLGDDSVVALGGSSNKKASKIKKYIEDTGDSSFINDSGRMMVVEQYIIKENRWRRLPNMIKARSDASACSYKDIVYVAGGFDGKECLASVEMYVRDFHQWTELPAMNQKRSGLSLVLYQGNLLALCGFGGKSTSQEEGEPKKRGRHKTVECLPLDRATLKYNHKKDTSWRILPAELNEGRSNFGACVLNDNQIVVCGGFNTGTLRSCERWHGSLEEVKSLLYKGFENGPTDYKKGDWHKIEDLPVEMSAMSVVTVSSTKKPLTGLLRAKNAHCLTERDEDLEMAITTPRN